MALTKRQQLFVAEYLIDLNATQAAIRAGYSVKRASEIGYQQLQKTTVKNEIDKAMAERSKRTGITQDRVLNEIAKIALSNMNSFVEWSESGLRYKDSSELSDEDTACIAEISETETQTKVGVERTKKIKLHSKMDALDKLARHLNLYNDKLNVSGGLSVQIVDDIDED